MDAHRASIINHSKAWPRISADQPLEWKLKSSVLSTRLRTYSTIPTGLSWRNIDGKNHPELVDFFRLGSASGKQNTLSATKPNTHGTNHPRSSTIPQRTSSASPSRWRNGEYDKYNRVEKRSLRLWAGPWLKNSEWESGFGRSTNLVELPSTRARNTSTSVETSADSCNWIRRREDEDDKADTWLLSVPVLEVNFTSNVSRKLWITPLLLETLSTITRIITEVPQ